MASPKPIILLIPGAWHPPSCYALLATSLAALGYPDFLCPSLATLGADAHGATWEADVALILDLVLPLFDEQGREIVIVGHSYGGLPACVATKGLGVRERAAAGKRGGFRYIVYLAAFAIPVRGDDCLTTFGGEWPPWLDAAAPYTRNQLITPNALAKEAFYNDLPPAEAQRWFDALVPHSQDALETGCPAHMTADVVTIPRTYVVTELDRALPAFVQESMIAAAPGWHRVERLPTGHSPFLSRPRECAELLVGIVEDAEGTAADGAVGQ